MDALLLRTVVPKGVKNCLHDMMSNDIVTGKTIGSLKKRADFLRLQKGGQKWITKSFIIQHKERASEVECDLDIRFGVTITKRIFKRAVDRNRVKRRLRHIASDILCVHGVSQMDYVLIGRKETLTRDFTDLQKDLKWALKRLSSQV